MSDRPVDRRVCPLTADMADRYDVAHHIFLEVASFACRDAGILDVRIIHGKGIGVLRTIVQGILAEHPAVESFAHPTDRGSWGATVARLRPKE